MAAIQNKTSASPVRSPLFTHPHFHLLFMDDLYGPSDDVTSPPVSQIPGEAGAQCRHLQALVDEKTAAVSRLKERLLTLDVDVAILVADRGR